MVDDVIKTITKNARTGNHGDGKIFIYDVRNIIRIRTREDSRPGVRVMPDPPDATGEKRKSILSVRP